MRRTCEDCGTEPLYKILFAHHWSTADDWYSPARSWAGTLEALRRNRRAVELGMLGVSRPIRVERV